MVGQVNLNNAYVIGQTNFDSWSNGFDANGYLKVLPHSEIKVAYNDPFLEWQQDHLNYRDGVFQEVADDGSYYSSWGPDKELDVTLTMDELEQLVIGGLGILEPGDHFIDWLDKATPYDYLRAYNSRITGPMLIVDPGDTIKITLINNLDGQVSNLHTHGLHVSPLGNGDNVLVAVEPNATREIVIELPDDHFIGPDWYHPHLHGSTNDQVAAGLGGYLLVNPSYNLPDLTRCATKTKRTQEN
ncbi:MAG: multicopper oxidase domain-containing protein [Snowella sp.]|nr:multicopper oxidase domain-containing protein [Snowella sp.]